MSKEHTLQEIADSIGCSMEYVRQIEAKAMAKVELELRRRGINNADFFREISGYQLPDEVMDAIFQ